VASDRGGCWEYVTAYATDAGIEPITACQRALKRTCDAVALILDTAEEFGGAAVRKVGALRSRRNRSRSFDR
jgi:hypothetical protein